MRGWPSSASSTCGSIPRRRCNWSVSNTTHAAGRPAKKEAKEQSADRNGDLRRRSALCRIGAVGDHGPEKHSRPILWDNA